LGTAGGIVFRAVVDAIALRIRLADAEVIVMGGVDDDLVLQLRIAAGQEARNVRRLHPRDLVLDVERGRERERHRLEVAVPRRGDELVEVLPTRLREATRGLFGGPGPELQARLGARRQIELLAAP